MKIHKIARMLNMSRSSVTQLLNKKPEGHEDYKRIMEAMDKLGMAVHETEHQRYAHRAKTIGVISRDLTETFFNEFISNIQLKADELGFGVVFVKKHNYAKQQVDYVKLLDEKVDGYIFLGEETSKNGEVELLLSQGVPCILIQGHRSIDGATYLNVNNEQAAFEAVSHLVKQNHKRIIHITGPVNYYEVTERKKGYQRAILDYDLEYMQTVNIDYESDYENIVELGCKIANRIVTDRITAAFCYNNLIATGVIDGLMEQGIIVPRDFSIVGFDDLSFRHLSRNWIPQLSSVKQPQKEMAFYAVEKLTEMMNGTVYDASKTFECSFVNRDSTTYL